ncbi:MAG TPA: VWA domain-containing protein [Terriglobales bacterium]|nr:VWA domain-containing protein [Terriglobales bacterium]
MSTWRFAGWALLFPLAVAAVGQQKKAPFVFRTNTRLVQINVVVDGRDGPVEGLKAGDFAVTDNGKQRKIQVFSADSASVRNAADAPAEAGASDAAPGSEVAKFSNTRARTDNMVVVLLDAINSADGTDYNLNGSPEWMSSMSFAMAKRGAQEFLKRMPEGLSVALYGLDERLRVLSDFTADRQQLLTALKAYGPETVQGADRGNPNTDVHGRFNRLNAEAQRQYFDNVVHARQIQGTVPALHAIAQHLVGLPGRISLVWIMTRPPLSGAVVEAALGRDNIAVYPVDARGLMAWDLQFEANDPPGFRAILQSQPRSLPVFEDIARETGGRAFINTNDIAGALRTAATDSEASYTLGFYVDASSLDNRFHQIQVKVHGKHLEARYAHGYWALKDAHGDSPRSVAELAAGLDAALRSPLEAHALPVDGHLVHTPQGLELDATVGIQSMRIAQENGQRTGTLVIETVAEDATGKPLQSGRITLNLDFTEAMYQHNLKTGLRFRQMIDVAPAAVTLHVIAQDAVSGALGSVIIPLASQSPQQH